MPPPSRALGRHTALAVLLATPLHLLTVAMTVLGVVLLWPDTTLFHGLLGVGCLVLAYFFRPALGDGAPDGTTVDLDRCPHTAALVREVAQAAGTRPPSRLLVTGDPRADARLSGLAGRSVTVGAPVWTALTGPERVAMVAHQVGHLRSGAVWLRRYVDGSVSTLQRWLEVVTPHRPSLPVRPEEQVMLATTGHHDALAISAAGGLFSDVVAVVLWSVRVLVRGYLRLLEHLATPSRLDQARQADLVTARVAGTGPTVGWLEVLAALPAVEATASRAASTRADVASAIATRMATYDAAQRRAVRSTAAAPVDAAHPPTGERIAAVESEPCTGPAVRVSAQQWEDIGTELAAGLAQQLRRFTDDLRYVR